ncbi:MFS transporter [Xylophilus sp. GOD-11R]|uniref:MFS transporter n=1 Tax=Xylophilus sp. GOD-11R TaxID=3089814 RepID=UPI00298CEB3F|nr:MFS transporter [Xylophilus sp. GOD-11R]WPB55288.1 MFS transporter [Xylophilus sp. GOD-11R]
MTAADTASTPASAPPPGVDAGRARLIALLVAGAFFMENFDATVITTALPAMATSFGVAPVALSAGVSAYLLALAVFIPVSGWVADRFGPRQVFAGAVALFTLASLACGLAQSLPVFIAARIVQGIGGALMVPVGRMVVLRTTPKSEVVKAIATITWPGLAAPLLGPPLGGWIASHWSWHWIFFINLPLGVLAIVLALRWIDGAPGGRRPFDWIGFVTSGAGLAALMYGLELTTQNPVDWPVVAAAVAAGLAGLLYSVRHMRRSAHPLVDLSVFGVRTFRASAIGGTLSRISISSAPFLLPLMFQLGLGFGMVQSGLLMIALFAGNLGIKPATTWVLRRFGFRSTLVGNGLLAAAGFVACAMLSIDTPLALMVVVLVFGGMTRSMQFTAVGTLAFCDTTPKQTAGASTLFSMFQQLSAGLGIAFGAVALRVSERFTGHGGSPGAVDFRFALLAMAVLTVLSLVDAWRLPAGAGDNVSGYRGASR